MIIEFHRTHILYIDVHILQYSDNVLRLFNSIDFIDETCLKMVSLKASLKYDITRSVVGFVFSGKSLTKIK